MTTKTKDKEKSKPIDKFLNPGQSREELRDRWQKARKNDKRNKRLYGYYGRERSSDSEEQPIEVAVTSIKQKLQSYYK